MDQGAGDIVNLTHLQFIGFIEPRIQSLVEVNRRNRNRRTQGCGFAPYFST